MATAWPDPDLVAAVELQVGSRECWVRVNGQMVYVGADADATQACTTVFTDAAREQSSLKAALKRWRRMEKTQPWRDERERR